MNNSSPVSNQKIVSAGTPRTPLSPVSSHGGQVTPISSANRSSTSSVPLISPLPLTPSPANVSGKGLQGGAKIIRNGVADLTNFLSTWKQLSQKSYNEFEKVVEYLISFDKEDASNQFTDKLDKQLNDMCNNLSALVSEMDCLILKCNQIVTRFDNYCTLENEQLNSSFGHIYREDEFSHSSDNIVLFYSWRSSKFYQVAKEIVDAYRTQTDYFRSISSQLVGMFDELMNNKDLRIFLLSSWLHNPYVTKEIESNLHVLQLETGLVSF